MTTVTRAVAAIGVVLAAAALWRLRRHQRWLEHLEGIVDPGTFS